MPTRDRGQVSVLPIFLRLRARRGFSAGQLTCSLYRSTKIGQALADLGFEQIRRKNGRFWKVAERPQVDIDNRIPDVDHSENVETDATF